MMTLIKKLGSVGFTVAISVLLILLLVVSTSMESLHGTPFAQKVFYQTRWFDFFISLLWINIFCSTVIRFPFKKSQIGFLVTHIGILGLLVGALITKAHAVEGQLSIFEGETGDSIRQDGHELAVIFPNREEARFELRKGDAQFVLTRDRLNASVPFCPLESKKGGGAVVKTGEPVSFNVTNIYPHASERLLVKQGSDQGQANHAAYIKIQSKKISQDASFWLVEREPGNELSGQAMAGPVKLVLSRSKKAAQLKKPVLRVLDHSGKEILAVDVDAKDLSKNIVLAKTGMSIKDLAYYPYATVAENKLVNYPEGKKLNPAVVYNLVDAKGVATRQVKFAFFPDFESMHSQGAKSAGNVQVRFEAGEPGDMEDLFDGLQLSFFYTDTKSWRYQAKLQDKVLSEGDIAAGQCLPSGLMDVSFCAQELMSHAVVSYELEPSRDDQGAMAVSFTVPSVSGSTSLTTGGIDTYWVMENRATSVHLPKGEVNFVLVPKMVKLPFSVALKEFRKIDYPGTRDPASFESDVVLTHPKSGVTMARTISMNHPLEYDGYKIFQSSYMNDPKYGKGSIFTVARNPGIPWIYISSIFACIGALVLFYWPKEKT